MPNMPPRSEETSQPAPRKPYQKPRLQAYGDLAELTKTVAGSQTNDGAGHPNKHYTS